MTCILVLRGLSDPVQDRKSSVSEVGSKPCYQKGSREEEGPGKEKVPTRTPTVQEPSFPLLEEGRILRSAYAGEGGHPGPSTCDSLPP